VNGTKKAEVKEKMGLIDFLVLEESGKKTMFQRYIPQTM